MVTLSKWHGLGNDYLIMAAEELPAPLTEKAIRSLCDRHRGIGSDGILLLAPPTGNVPQAVARMRVFNPDGSEAEMCGNGIRMFARYLVERGLVAGPEFVVETLAGPVTPCILPDELVRVDMGRARFRSPNIAWEGAGDAVNAALEAGGQRYLFTFVDVGNPHCVIVVDDLEGVDVAAVGPLIERHPFFPQRVNVEFVRPESDGSVSMRVWERGAAETQACGTGATAVGVACVRLGLARSPVTVHLLGGDLVIEAELEASCVQQEASERESAGGAGSSGAGPGLIYHAFMTGPAEKVFEATLAPDLLRRLGWCVGSEES